ncbi:MAG TPA: M23 family metallopeptidase [Polyangiaceae bacterium]|jgi:murein DD-endopeptidase MepM/ murein hydrolase activator NlpD
MAALSCCALVTCTPSRDSRAPAQQFADSVARFERAHETPFDSNLSKKTHPAGDVSPHDRQPIQLPDAVEPPSRWSYVLPLDHGIRSDPAGAGEFLAPRHHGRHQGIDLAAPVGTAVLAACAGRALSFTSPSSGLSVRLVCALGVKYSREPAFASILYAHLSWAAVGSDWVPVEVGDSLGQVGKTGNAGASWVEPHLHLEFIVASEARALAERHWGWDVATTPEADEFFEQLRTQCLEPAGLRPLSGAIRRGRRADPFLALYCLGTQKPNYSPFYPAHHGLRWSGYYEARSFDVDRMSAFSNPPGREE